MFISTFINNPAADEFYPRRLYANRAIGPDLNYCVVNNAASMAWRAWDAATGLQGLMACIREAQQPSNYGSDLQVREVAREMIYLACKHGHLEEDGHAFRKTA